MGFTERLLRWFSFQRWLQQAMDERKTARDFEILRAGGWTCHACGEARPDELIAVRSVIVADGVQHNRQYCVDRPGCAETVAAQLDEIRRRAGRWKEQW